MPDTYQILFDPRHTRRVNRALIESEKALETDQDPEGNDALSDVERTANRGIEVSEKYKGQPIGDLLNEAVEVKDYVEEIRSGAEISLWNFTTVIEDGDAHLACLRARELRKFLICQLAVHPRMVDLPTLQTATDETLKGWERLSTNRRTKRRYLVNILTRHLMLKVVNDILSDEVFDPEKFIEEYVRRSARESEKGQADLDLTRQRVRNLFFSIKNQGSRQELADSVASLI